MLGSFSNARRPSPGSWIDNWLRGRERHPDAVDVGVRVISGALPGERTRWSFRTSGFDRHGPADTVVLNHGAKTTLTLRADTSTPPTAGGRPNHAVFAATEVTSHAEVQLSVPLDELARFGLAL